MLEKDEHFASCIESALDQYDCNVLLMSTLLTTLQTFAAKTGSTVLNVPIGVCPRITPSRLITTVA